VRTRGERNPLYSGVPINWVSSFGGIMHGFQCPKIDACSLYICRRLWIIVSVWLSSLGNCVSLWHRHFILLLLFFIIILPSSNYFHIFFHIYFSYHILSLFYILYSIIYNIYSIIWPNSRWLMLDQCCAINATGLTKAPFLYSIFYILYYIFYYMV